MKISSLSTSTLVVLYQMCPVQDVGYIHLVWNYWYAGHCFLTYPPPCDVSVHGQKKRTGQVTPKILCMRFTYCGEYGWVLWASWPRREPRYAGNRHWPVTVHRPSLKTSQRGKCSVEPSSVFQLLSPGKVPKNPLETRLEATPVKSQCIVRNFHYIWY